VADELEFKGNETQTRKVEKLPSWLKAAKLKANILKLPQREEVTVETNDQLIVEFYSR